MDDVLQYFIGILVGLGAGIAIGLYIGKRHKSWSEMTPREKKKQIIAIIVESAILMAGVIYLIYMVFT